VIFRIPTPAFGAGLMEQISNWQIKAAAAANASAKSSLGITLGGPLLLAGRPARRADFRAMTASATRC
jgi:hypothetical protein